MGLSAGTAFVDVAPKIGADFQGQVASKLGPIGGKLGSVLGGAMGPAVVATAGVAVVAGLKNIGGTFDEAFDTIRIGTGATGADLAALEDDFKAVFAAVPTDAMAAASAIADLNTRTGATGEVLQNTAAAALELSRITGDDLGKVIESGTRAWNAWGIEVADSEKALDAVFRASQATGTPVSTLQDQLVKFGPALREFGFGFEESAALLGQFEREGINVARASGSLSIAFAKFAREGREPAEALQETIDAIKNAGSEAEGNALALQVFGARAGPEMVQAIRQGRFELGALFTTVRDGGETIRGAADDTADMAESWNKLKNRALVAIEPLATGVFNALGKLFEFLADKIGPVMDVVGGVLSTIGSIFGSLTGQTEDAETSIGGAVGGIGAVFSTLGEIFQQVFGVVRLIFDGLKAFWDTWGGTIVAVFQNLWNTVVGILQGAFQVIKGIFDVVLGILTGDWRRAWEGIKNIFGGAAKAITSAISGAFNLILTIVRGIFTNIVGAVASGIGSVLRFFWELPGKIFGFLKDLPGQMLKFGTDLIMGLISGVANLPGLLFNKLKDGIGGAINKVKSFFGIGSPSKVVARELGVPIGQGPAEGAEVVGPLLADTLTSGITDAVDQAHKMAFPALAGAFTMDTLDPSRRAAWEAGNAGGGDDTTMVFTEGAIVVNNPTPEEASLSIPRELRRLASDLARP